MAKNKLVNILGGGIFSAAIMLLILWATYTAYSPLWGPELISNIDKIKLLLVPGSWILILTAGLVTGFILSIVTPDEKIEPLYMRYGLFLGVVVLFIAASLATIEDFNTPKGMYIFPTIPEIFIRYFAVVTVAFVLTSIASSIGYWLGCVLKPSRTSAIPLLSIL